VDLEGANLAFAALTGANLTGATFTGADLTGASLAGATVTGATWTTVTWLDTTCPDGSNSNAYVDGCFSALDTTPPSAAPAVTAGTAGTGSWYTAPVTVTWNWTDDGTISTASCTTSSTAKANGDPVTLTATCTDLAGNVGHDSYQVDVDATGPSVTVTGVRQRGVYAVGKVPAAGCTTTDVSGVVTAAKVSVVAAGSQGVGKVTATCAGATGVSGARQHAPVRAVYTVAYGFDKFSTPAAGSTVARSPATLTVRFRLAGASGAGLPVSVSSALAAARHVHVTLTGPGIAVTRATCSWLSSVRKFSCVLSIPSGVKTGTSHRYVITVTENPGSGFVAVPTRTKAAGSEVIHFR
jgi:hypothetical protein